MQQTLIAYKGLPGCGKTTEALKLVDAGKGKVVRVNKDDTRAMIHNNHWSQEREKATQAAHYALIKAFLKMGLSVVNDDTNFHKPHLDTMRQLARDCDVDFKIIDMTDVPLETCIKRDAARTRTVGETVIKNMWFKHVARKLKQPDRDPLKWDVIIVDMDGTLADMGDRNPFDASTCEDDKPREFVLSLLRTIRMSNGVATIILSGREEKYREQTQRWLDKHCIQTHMMFMRATGDGRKDSIVKEEIYRKEIEPNFNVKWVIDDRPQVIRMWRELGLPVLDVGNSIEF